MRLSRLTICACTDQPAHDKIKAAIAALLTCGSWAPAPAADLAPSVTSNSAFTTACDSSGFTPATYAKWNAETPEDFVFSIKGNRFVTNRKILAEAGESMAKFFAQGLEELGEKLGPIVWQFAPTKKFEPDDFEAFLKLLPQEHAGRRLRHALEVRHGSFAVPEFVALAAKYGAAICYAHHHDYPEFADVTSNTYYDWMLDRIYLFIPAQAFVAQMIGTLAEFPPRQEPASFNLDRVLEKLKAGAPSS